jgi:hypothetical protein
VHEVLNSTPNTRELNVNTPQDPKEILRQLAETHAGSIKPDEEFLESLRRLTGHSTTLAMVERFKVLAGIGR